MMETLGRMARGRGGRGRGEEEQEMVEWRP
jgi:hypothetical protein